MELSATDKQVGQMSENVRNALLDANNAVKDIQERMQDLKSWRDQVRCVMLALRPLQALDDSVARFLQELTRLLEKSLRRLAEAGTSIEITSRSHEQHTHFR